MIRYVLNDDARVGYTDIGCKNTDKIEIPKWKNTEIIGQILAPRFVDILEVYEDRMRVNIFLKDGQILTCWLFTKGQFPLTLYNEEEAYDGRFNSTQQNTAQAQIKVGDKVTVKYTVECTRNGELSKVDYAWVGKVIEIEGKYCTLIVVDRLYENVRLSCLELY